MKQSKSISGSDIVLLIIAVLLVGFTLFVEQNFVPKSKYDEVAQSLARRDSMWYAHHEIPEQVQTLLTGVEDSALIYKQIVAESGNFNSPQFRRNRNLFGFRDGRDYLKFDHWRHSFDKYMNEFYCDKRYGESFCQFLRRRKFGANNHVDYCIK